jgi:hypothetical protein
MRCCSSFAVLVLLVLAFAAGFALRDALPTTARLTTRLRQAVTAAAPPQAANPAAPTSAARPPIAPASTAAPANAPSSAAPAVPASGPLVQQNGRDVTVRLDEATLTQQANANLAGRPFGDTPFGEATVRNVTIHLRNGQIIADGTAQLCPTIAPISVTSTATAESGRLRVVVSDAKVGGVPLPASMRQEIETALQAQVDQLMAQQRVRVQSVTIADGRLVATGTTA